MGFHVKLSAALYSRKILSYNVLHSRNSKYTSTCFRFLFGIARGRERLRGCATPWTEIWGLGPAVPRPFLALACTAAVVACSDSSSSPADRVELRTDATSYEVVSGVPRFLSLTLRNNGPSSIDATLCAAGTGTIISEISYQVYQGGLWVDIPYGRVDCGAQGVLRCGCAVPAEGSGRGIAD